MSETIAATNETDSVTPGPARLGWVSSADLERGTVTIKVDGGWEPPYRVGAGRVVVLSADLFAELAAAIRLGRAHEMVLHRLNAAEGKQP